MRTNRQKGTRRTALRLAAVAFALLTAALGAWRLAAARARPAPAYELVTVDRGPIVSRVTATGTVSALVTVQVGAQVSGRILEIKADFNAPVKKGQVIARIDPELLEAAVEQARANDAAARAGLVKAEVQAEDAARQLGRAQKLAADKLIAPADLDTAQANADAARAQVVAARGTVAQAAAARHQAEVNLAYTTIVSPTDGVVISRNVDIGQTVAAALQAPTLFTIAQDLRKMHVDTSVAEADVGRLAAGMSASFTVDAYPGRIFRGTVSQVRNAPQMVQSVVTYDAVIDVENPDLLLKPGMTATVAFTTGERKDALRVPNAALRFRDGGGKAIYALREEKPVRVAVQAGLTDGARTEIVSGAVQAGERVVTGLAGLGGQGEGQGQGQGTEGSAKRTSARQSSPFGRGL